MRDPYDVLGVPRGASASNIKSAFRKLAKKHASRRQQERSESGRTLFRAEFRLRDSRRREEAQAFDAGEIDAEGKPKFQGFEGVHPGGFGGGPGRLRNLHLGTGRRNARARGRARRVLRLRAAGIDEILKGMFGNARRGRGGAGAGGGTFEFEADDIPPPRGQDIAVPLTVSLSDLTGNATRRVRLPTGKDVEVKIPAGIADGQTIRLKGQGMTGPGEPGDVLITISVAEHPYFERDGQNLRLDLPITLYEAVLGAKVRVPTLDGAVELAIPANTSSGRTFRLRGKGLPGKDGAGDLYGDRAHRAARSVRRQARRTDARMARQQALRSAQEFRLSGSASRRSSEQRQQPLDAGAVLRRRRRAVLDLLIGGLGDRLQPQLVRPGRSPHSRSRPRSSAPIRQLLVLVEDQRAAFLGELRAIQRHALAAALSYMNSAAGPCDAGQQASAQKLQVEGREFGRAQLRADAPRQPRQQMRFGRADLDRVAHLVDVEPVRGERVSASSRSKAESPRGAAEAPRAIQPATPPTDKGRDHRRRRDRAPAALPLRSTLSSASRSGTGSLATAP